MRYKTARFLSALFGVALVILIMTIVQSFILIFMLGTSAGIWASESTMKISHAAVLDATRFIANMTIPIAIFFAIVGMMVVFKIHGIIDKLIMRRVSMKEKLFSRLARSKLKIPRKKITLRRQ
jgi:hypothetical protein